MVLAVAQVHRLIACTHRRAKFAHHQLYITLHIHPPKRPMLADAHIPFVPDTDAAGLRALTLLGREEAGTAVSWVKRPARKAPPSQGELSCKEGTAQEGE